MGTDKPQFSHSHCPLLYILGVIGLRQLDLTRNSPDKIFNR